ncbi:hypothetical protein [Pararhodobacter zhoushanensis]|uniref:Uncharacterized protein n=1 Tax=Pararhodobacter zhoushanensis TaxID=2479545 RepID=A0ABT3H184_9RHOB|nr:hypothetical protein [Pararhodobacter zhoushanensis]MCW1933490.1 hypothetical protein [Pararhodobacter zhoushanensis]
MAHSLSALVARGPGDAVAAAKLGLTLLEAGDFVIVALDPDLARASARRLGVEDRQLSDMAPDKPVTLRFASELGLEPVALIHTEDLDDDSAQWATVYHGCERTMPVSAGLASINAALERVGVRPDAGWDAFDTIGVARLLPQALRVAV